MKIFLITLFLMVNFVSLSFAGGAVAARQQGQKKAMQQQQQQQMMQQRLQYEQAQKNAIQKKAIENQQEAILEKQQNDDRLIENAHEQENQRQQELQAEVKDVVDINQLITSFEISSEAWPLIIDREAKSVIITAYIDQYRKQGVTINQSSIYYADLIDGMVQQAPDILNQPLKQVLRVLAVIEYDFNNGQNKDEMALKVLGNRDAVAQNKKRLGL